MTGENLLLIELIDHYLNEQFDKLLHQESQVQEGSNPEGVHQMRVATRCIRAAFRAFRKFLPVSKTKIFNREFKWIASVLGEVRDLEVYRGNLERDTGKLAEEDSVFLNDYYQHLDNQLQQARTRLLECLRSERYSQLKISFAEFLKQGLSQSSGKPISSNTIRAIARKALRKQYKTVLRKGRAITPDSSGSLLHELRIECKRLRYLLVVFRPLYGKNLNQPTKQLKRLQRVLGEFQDTQVAIQNIRTYANRLPMQTENRGQLVTLGQLIYVQQMQGAKQRTAFNKVWQHFDSKNFRKKILGTLEKCSH